ncbi:ATP-binding cassette domain-containing protein [Paracoccus sp. SJTW-4]|uniref:ATP-binding cassette domain-containing protein n=1 Tax=Paracoccus sp. SJTW-4 TaxID=3078428 RepID=UPI0039EAE0D9
MGDEDFPVQARALNHWFGRGEARKQALYDINLRIARGSLTVLVGPSGSGKTTLLTLLGCLREVQQGSVVLLGHELHGATPALATALRRRLGFIFQAHNLHESLTAAQNVMMGVQVLGRVDKAQAQAAAAHVLGLLGLSERLDYLPANLSGGQKQRVAIARALVGTPSWCWPTNPPPRWTATAAPMWWSCSSDWGRRAAPPRSWSPTTTASWTAPTAS